MSENCKLANPAPGEPEPAERRGGTRLLQGWDPENNWNSSIAWTTLGVTTYSMILAFAVWFIPATVGPKLNSVGFNLTDSQIYWLGAMPGLSCGFIRFIFTFLPPIIGTRKLVGISSALYLIPLLGWFFTIQSPDTPFWWLLTLAFMCGIGGGSFSGYMPSTGYFFPKRKQGLALGIQAGIGNLGMSIIQLAGPFLMTFALFGLTWLPPFTDQASGKSVYLYNIPIFFFPWVILAAVLAFALLRDVPVKANIRQQLNFFSNPDTWYMTLMYVMTFGLFSGFSGQFGALIKAQYGEFGFDPAAYAFLGPLVGALVRSAWGPLCDRFTGGLWTFVSAVGMAATLVGVGFYLSEPSAASFTGFLWFMLAMFFFSGIGNAGTFKQMPMIMPKLQAGGAIGFTAAVASFGPFFVGMALVAFATSPATWFYICAVYCALCAVICWVRYARPGAPKRG